MSTDRKDLGNYGFRGNSGGQGSTFSSAKPGSSAEIMPTGMGAAINVAEVVNRTNEALLTRLRGLGGPGGGVIGRRHGVGLGTAVAAVAAGVDLARAP
jgi:hypothetical protein